MSDLRTSLEASRESLEASKRLTDQLQGKLTTASGTLDSLRESLVSSKELLGQQTSSISDLRGQISKERILWAIIGAAAGAIVAIVVDSSIG